MNSGWAKREYFSPLVLVDELCEDAVRLTLLSLCG